MAKEKSIVLCGEYGNHSNVLFMMAHDDFRFGTDNYKVVTGGKAKRDPEIGNVFIGDNGTTYKVFPDWSARAMTNPMTVKAIARDAQARSYRVTIGTSVSYVPTEARAVELRDRAIRVLKREGLPIPNITIEAPRLKK